MYSQCNSTLSGPARTSTAPELSKVLAAPGPSLVPSTIWTTVGDDQPLSDDAIRTLASLFLDVAEPGNQEFKEAA